jgi:molecular chaperone GrpE
VSPAEREPASNPAAPGRGSSVEEPEAEAEGKVFPAGAEEAAGSDSVQAEDVSADLDVMLEDTKRERDEYLELAKRARADFENYRKRAARETADAERRGRVSVARGLVPALDNLERALRSSGVDPALADGGAAAATESPTEEVSGRDALARGVELVYRELRDALTRAGVESYDPVGEEFDPAWHEAVATRPAEDASAGTVIETLDKGYRLDGQVLRAAKVIVAE